MRTLIPGALWFILVFIGGLLWFFPIDVVVLNGVAQVEARSGLTIKWRGERWSVWRSVLNDVNVYDPSGRVLATLTRIEILPRPDGIYLRGLADWGPMTVQVRPGGAEADFDGYPVAGTPALRTSSALPEMSFDGGKLKAHVVYEEANSQVHGTYGLGGRVRLFFYEGPIDLSGSFQLTGKKGRASVEVLGDRLRGHGDVELDASTGDWARLRVNGSARAELQGTAHIVRIAGEAGNLSITPQ